MALFQKNSWIRTAYLYLFALVGLALVVIGFVRLLDMGMKIFIFKEADKPESIRSSPPYPPFGVLEPAPLAKEKGIGTVTISDKTEKLTPEEKYVLNTIATKLLKLEEQPSGTGVELMEQQVIPNTKEVEKKAFLVEIFGVLTAYENTGMGKITGNLDQLMEILFVDCKHLTLEKIREYGNVLECLELQTNFIKLLISLARGKLYLESGYGAKTVKEFEERIQNTFGISYRHATRYMQFYQNILKFPRLLLIGKEMNEINLNIKINE